MSFKLCYLEFDYRFYRQIKDAEGNVVSIDDSVYTDYTITLTFDKLNSMNIDEDLQVCTAETIRGKNKTFNAYLQPKAFNISGSFSDRVSTDIVLTPVLKEGETAVEKSDILTDGLYGRRKSEFLNNIFTSMVEDTRLLNIKTFFKDYENYIITNFNITYTDNSTIDIELNLKEVLLRDLDAYEEPELTFSITEELTRDLIVQYYGETQGNMILDYLDKLKEINESTYTTVISTLIQGGHYA